MYQFLKKDKIPVLSIKDCTSLCRDDAKRYIIKPQFISEHAHDAHSYETSLRKWEATTSKGNTTAKPPQPSWYKAYTEKLDSYNKLISNYIEANTYQYYVCSNCWLLMASDIAPLAADYILTVIKREGFLSAIDHFSSVSSQFITGSLLPMADQALYDQVVQAQSLRMMQTGRPHSQIISDPDALFLLLCRYPKRFTPAELVTLEESTFASFQSVQNDNRVYDSSSRLYDLSPSIVSSVRDIIAQMLPWKKVCKEIRQALSQDYHNLVIPSGSSPLGSRLSDKVKALYEAWPMSFNPIFGDRPSLTRGESRLSRWDYGALARYPAALHFVPKSARTLRSIAMEYPEKYAPARRVAKILDKYCPACIPLHDQSVSQRDIRIGSRAGDRASIDATDASNRITYRQFAQLFPSEFTALVYPLLPHYYTYGDKQYTLYGMATAGNPLTFILESIFFAALAVLGTIIASGYTLTIKQAIALVTVYGDDIICLSEYLPTIIEVLELFHVQVNNSKSFSADELFQESCGMDVIDGVDVASFYWPRKAFPISSGKELVRITTESDEDGSSITSYVFSFITHQQSLATISYVAATFMLNEIKEAIPNVGISPLFGLHELPWMPYAYSKTSLPPIDEEDITAEHLSWFHDHEKQLSRQVYCTPYVAQKTYKAYGDIPPYLTVFCYTQYLSKGPLYEDPLMELLGISTSRLSQLTTGFEVRTKITD